MTERRQSKMNLGYTAQRQKVKIEFTICIKQVLGLPKSTTSNLFISWKRGSKKENSGESKHASVKDQTAVFDFTLPLLCTLYQDPKKGFEEKSVVFTLKEEGKGGKKSSTLGKLAIDLAEFANSKTERIRTFTIKEKKTPVANITLSFKTTWLKMDGKTLVRADQAEASGKEKINIDGNDYYLQTEDELSIDETDHKSGNEPEESDDDVVDFEDDNEKEKEGGSISKSPNGRRKSGTPGEAITSVSSLLSAKSPAIPTPQPATTTLSPTPSATTATPVTPTTPPSIQVTSPASESRDGDDPKVKKYKKKLKHARKEIDDLKAELDKKVKAPQGDAGAAAESTAKLTAALATEAKLRKDLDEANKKVAEAQATADANKRGDTDAKAQADARIKQLESDLSQRDAAIQAAEAKLRDLEKSVSESASKNDKGSREYEAKLRESEAKIAELESQRKLAEEAANTAGTRVRELEEVEKRSRSSDEAAKEYEKKIQSLEAALSEERKKNEELESKRIQDEENAKAASNINAEMARVLESLEAKIAEFQRSTNEREAHEQDEYLKYIEEIKRLEAENLEIENENDSLEEKIKELEERQSSAAGDFLAKIGQLETALATTVSRADRAERENEDLQKRVNDTEKKAGEEAQKLQKRVAELEAQLASEAGKGKVVDELQEKNDDLEEQINKMNSANEAQKKELGKLTALVAEMEEEKQQMNSVRSQAEATERQKKQLEEEVDMLNEKVTSLEAQVQAGAGQEEELVAELQKKNKKAEKEISSLKSQLEEVEAAKSSQERELEKALEEKDEEKQNAQSSATKITELEDEVSKYKKKAKKAEAQALEMEKQLDDAKQQQNGNADEEQRYKDLEEKYNTAQVRIEELDDETDRLRKRESALNELNETTEKQIEELEAELRQVKTRAVPDSDEGATAQLQKELESAREEAAQAKARVRELESKPAQAPASPSMGAGAGSEEVARLQREVEDYKKVEKAVYWDEIGFTAADISKTATAVWQLLAATRELDAQPRSQDASYPLTPLAHKVMTALDKSYRRTQKDDKQVAYWLACACSLLHFIHQRDDIPSTADPVISGVQVDRDQFVSGANHAEQFGRSVQGLTLDIYGQLVTNLQESFQKAVIPAFLREDLAVMDKERTPSRVSSNTSLSPNGVHSPSSSSSSHSANIPSLTVLTNSLTNILTILRDARCPPVVVKQIFHQLIHFIAGCVLNALLYGKEVSTATHGLRIKLAVSRIDEWLAKQESDVSGAGERLNLLRDAANVLVLDKSLFLDADTIASIFHSLNLVQVRKLLDLFQPDSVSPANVPQSVKQMMDTYWGYSPHNMPLVVDVTSLVVVN